MRNSNGKRFVLKSGPSNAEVSSESSCLTELLTAEVEQVDILDECDDNTLERPEAMPSFKAELSYRDNELQFRWKGQSVTGTKLHAAVLRGDMDAVHNILAVCPELIDRTCAYKTKILGNMHEFEGMSDGACQAIHIAASSGNVEIAKILIEADADVNAKGTRNFTDHYDVLHHAVHAGGSGGSTGMVEFLLKAQADIGHCDLDGRNILHLAFECGSTQLLLFLRDEIESRHRQDMHQVRDSQGMLSLEVGIVTGRMTLRELVECAPPSQESLHVFVRRRPECIPIFLQRIPDLQVFAQNLSPEVCSTEDICQLLIVCAEAATAILDMSMMQPEEDSYTMHRLPVRVNLAPRSFWGSIEGMVNPRRRHLVMCKPDLCWRFDSHTHEFPDWHATVLHHGSADAMHTVQTKVCVIPNLVCPQLFQSLSQTQELSVFEHDFVRAAIDYAFCQGACKLDLTQFIMSCWTLALLTFETLWFVDSRIDRASRSLLARGHQDVQMTYDRNIDSLQASILQEDDNIFNPHQSVSGCWLVTRGCTDLFLEVVQFLGYCSQGRPHLYLDGANMSDLLRAVASILLVSYHGHRGLHVIVILSSWARLVECMTISTYIANSILPIRRLAQGLMPAMVVTLVGFLAFTHASYEIEDRPRKLWPDQFSRSFELLITAALPAAGEISNDFHLVLTYVSVLMFTIFFMNIFIGVMSEQYMAEREQCNLSFQQLRATSCHSYLLRTIVLPCDLLSSDTALKFLAAAMLMCLILQAVGFWGGSPTPGCWAMYVALQLGIVLCCYQCPQCPWSQKGDTSYHMWVFQQVGELREPWKKEETLLEQVENIFGDRFSALESKTSLDLKELGSQSRQLSNGFENRLMRKFEDVESKILRIESKVQRVERKVEEKFNQVDADVLRNRAELANISPPPLPGQKSRVAHAIQEDLESDSWLGSGAAHHPTQHKQRTHERSSS